MKIWIINQYASLPGDGIGGRHRHLARELALLGHEVTVIAARITHLTRDIDRARAAPPVQAFEGFRFVRIDVPQYNGARDLRRVLGWFVFGLRIPSLTRRLNESPDVVLYSSPSLPGVLGAEHLTRRANARLVFEVRDIWPLTLIQLGSYAPRHPFIQLLQWIEDRAYRKADRVISNLRGAVGHMEARGMDPEKFKWIPNGFSKSENHEPPSAAISKLRSTTRDRFSVGYTGTLGGANALDNLLQAASLLKHERDIVFVLVGSGSEDTSLSRLAQKLELDNVVFIPAVPKDQVQNVLLYFDVCVLCWRDRDLYRYGTAANKIFDYFRAGKPVVQAYSGAYDLVSQYDCGLTVPADDAVALAAAIVRMRNLPSRNLARMGSNGRRAAFAHHEYGKIAKELEEVLGDRPHLADHPHGSVRLPERPPGE